MDERDRRRLQEKLTDWKEESLFSIHREGYLQPSPVDGSYASKDQKQRMAWLLTRCEGRVLDVGCGIGYLLNKYEGPGTGIDVNRYHVAEAQLSNNRSNQEFLCMDVVFGLPMSWTGHFDAAVCAEVFEHIGFSHATFALKEVLRCVKNKVLLTFPYMHDGIYSIGGVENSEHRWSPTKELIERLAKDSGARIDTFEELANRQFAMVVMVNL